MQNKGLTAAESMNNIRMDLRLQLLSLGGNKPYFRRSPEQLLKVLKMMNRRDGGTAGLDRKAGLSFGVDMEDIYQKFDKAKDSIAVDDFPKDSRPRYKGSVSTKWAKLLTGKMGRSGDVAKKFAEHVVERNIVEAVGSVFQRTGDDGKAEMYDQMINRWDKKMRALASRMRTVEEKVYPDPEKLSSYKPFVLGKQNSEGRSHRDQVLISAVRKFATQKSSLINGNGLVKSTNQHMVNAESEPGMNDEDSQDLTNSIINNDQYMKFEKQLMEDKILPLCTGFRKKQRAVMDLRDELLGSRHGKSQKVWRAVTDLVGYNLNDKKYGLYVEAVQGMSAELMGKYGGYSRLVQILRKTYDARISGDTHELEEIRETKEPRFRMNLRIPGQSQTHQGNKANRGQSSTSLPVENNADNHKALDLLAHVEAIQNSAAKDMLKKLQENLKRKIISANQKSRSNFILESSSDKVYLGLVKGYLEGRIMSEDHMRDININHDTEDLPLFGMLYYLFISGSYQLMGEVLRNYKGSLQEMTRQLLPLFEDWLVIFNSCHDPKFFSDQNDLQMRRMSMLGYVETLKNPMLGSSPFLELLLQTLLQQDLEVPMITDAVVRSYQDLLILGLAGGLDFGIQRRNDIGIILKKARAKILGEFLNEGKTNVGFLDEMAQSLQHGPLIITMSQVEGMFEEMLHCGILMNESGFGEILDLYRDTFFLSENEPILVQQPDQHDYLNLSRQTLKDWTLLASTKFAEQICKSNPVESLLYIDLADLYTPFQLEQGLAILRNNANHNSFEPRPQTFVNPNGQLLSMVKPQNLILLQNKLNILKVSRGKDLIVGYDLFTELFSVNPRSIKRFRCLRNLCSGCFFKELLKMLCDASEVSIPKIQRVRLFEESGRVSNLLEMSINQYSNIIETLSDFCFKEEVDKENSLNFGINRDLRIFRKSQSSEAKKLMRPKLCLPNGDRFRKVDYLGQIIFANSNFELFQQNSKLKETVLLAKIQEVFYQYLNSVDTFNTLAIIDNSQIYEQYSRLSDKSVLSLLRLLELHLFLLRKDYLESLNYARRGGRRYGQDVDQIKRFFMLDMMNLKMQNCNNQAALRIRKNIQSLFNASRIMD